MSKLKLSNYPHYLDWKQRVWIIREGDLVRLPEGLHKVTQVIKSVIKGKEPEFLLEPVSEEERKRLELN